MRGVESPVITKRIRPKYPELGVRMKLEGYVILSAVMRKDGTIDDVKVLRGMAKGKFGFEEEAIEALKQWQFVPGKFNGEPADVRMNLQVSFALSR